MIELSIRFNADEKQPDGRITVSLFRPGGGVGTDPQAFAPPLDDKILADIHWYLEVFSTWPTGPDYERAEEIESKLEAWGRALRDSIRTSMDAADVWREFLNAEGDKLLTIDATDPRVLRLPWELLADEGGHLFSRGVGVRRRLRKVTSSKQKPVALPVRILVVVARPDDAGFIDPRAITRPLLDAVDGLGESVVVEFLPRPTLRALSQRLRDPAAPPVHVVHFDGHGVYDKTLGLGFLLFENDDHKSDAVDANRLGTLLNQTGVPLMALNACQSGKQEDANPYASVAARLIRAGVASVLAMNYSVLVVAAHKFVAAFYAALAHGRSVGQAVDAGRFALLEDIDRHTLVRPNAAGEMAEEKIRLRDWFLPALYQQSDDPVIFPADPQSPTPDPRSPIPTRQTYPGLVRAVQEHFNKDELRQLCHKLGVAYDDLPGEGNAARALSLVELAERHDAVDALVEAARRMRPLAPWDAALTPSAAAEALHPTTPAPRPPRTAGRAPAALPPPPRHGFHGRSREMLLLDRAFRDSAVVVVHGFGGLGKTALATEAGRWFTRTGRFPGGAAFVSFEQGGSLAQLCSWVGQTVSGDPDWVIHGEGDVVERVGRLLAQRPALLILDNFESVLGRDPLTPPEEVAQVLDAVAQWAGIGEQGSGIGPIPTPQAPVPRVLITTRDTGFNDPRFAPSQACRHVALQGLAEADALALAAAVLDHHAIDRSAVPRADLVALMRHLGGHPLSLTLVLPHLRAHTAQELIARFEELLPGFVQGKAEQRNESLAVSLDFSLRRLGEATRAALPDLAVFAGMAMETNVLQITEMDDELWRVARGELEQAALVTLESVPGVNPPFLSFHSTLLPYLATRLSDERRRELETRYWQYYYELAKYLYNADTQTPHQARAIAVREMPNLRRALDLALAAAQTDPALWEQVVDFAARIALFLDVFGRRRERDAMMEQVSEQFAARGGTGGKPTPDSDPTTAPPVSPPITKAEYLLLSRRGETLWQQGRAAQAEALFRQLLARLQAGADYDAAYDIAMTQMRLGRCLEAQGRPSQAIPYHEQARDGFAALGENNKSAKQMLGYVHADLADNLANIGKFDEAEKNYKASLEIARKREDHRSAGVALGQLGNLALQRGDLPAARERHTEALHTFQRLGEPQSEAVAWHQLGMVAEEGRAWAEAERCYRESLRIKEAQRDWPGVARTCNQLAIVAEGDGRYADAERWYLRAIELGERLGDKQGLAKRLNNLADLYLGQQRLDEAEQYARRALAIKETLDLSAAPWKTYQILAQIAAAKGDTEAARAWRRQEQESYAAYAGAAHKLPSWAPDFIRAVVAAAEGVAEAQEAVAQILPQLEKSGWTNLVAAVERILAGEPNSETLFDNLDREDAYIIRAILQQLAGEDQPRSRGIPTAPTAPAEERGRATATAGAAPSAQEATDFFNTLLAGVVAVARGAAPPELGVQLHAVTRGLATDDTIPPELRGLGRALNAVLAGDRDPDLADLPPQLAAAVRQVLAQIERGE